MRVLSITLSETVIDELISRVLEQLTSQEDTDDAPIEPALIVGSEREYILNEVNGLLSDYSLTKGNLLDSRTKDTLNRFWDEITTVLDRILDGNASSYSFTVEVSSLNGIVDVSVNQEIDLPPF